jgi:hypothetical protein
VPRPGDAAALAHADLALPRTCIYRDRRQSDPTGTAELWDDAYANDDSTRSWLQARPASLRTLSAAQITMNDSVIDIGGGASRHADALLD